MKAVLSCTLSLGSLLVLCGLLSGRDQTNRATVTVEVTDPSGTGIPNAEVRFSPLPEDASGLKTAKNGELTLNLTPGNYTLSVVCAGFKPSSRQITVRNVNEIQTIPVGLQIGDTGSPYVYSDAVTPSKNLPAGVLKTSQPSPRPPHRLVGVIVDSMKTPIAFAHVQLLGKDGKFKTETQADGSFSVRLPSGDYSLTVTAAGFCTHAQRLSIRAKEISQSTDFTLLECSDCPRMDVDFAPPDIGTDGAPPEGSDFPTLPSMKYQTEEMGSGALSLKSNPLMRFGKREQSGDSVVYSGLFLPRT